MKAVIKVKTLNFELTPIVILSIMKTVRNTKGGQVQVEKVLF